MSLYLLIPTLLVVAVLGWMAGMWTRQRSNRWCDACGAAFNCPECAVAGAHRLPASR